MRKFITSNFELDLSLFGISDVENNSSFQESFSSKITYPFDIYLTDDLDIASGFISQYNTTFETLFDGWYHHHDKIEKAKLEIIEITGLKLSCTLEFGLEQFPSWDKKLSELKLEKFNLPNGVSLYEYANNMVGQTYPQTNFVFPQIHTDKYSQDDNLFASFQQILNNRVNGVFLENTWNSEEEVYDNRNIIVPLPNWLYLLKQGVIDEGYQLAGDILNESKLLNRYVLNPGDYFTNLIYDSYDLTLMDEEYYNSVQHFDLFMGSWNKSIVITINRKIKFYINGNGHIAPMSDSPSNFYLLIDGAVIYEDILPSYPIPQSVTHEFTFDDYILILEPGTHTITATSNQRITNDPRIICDLSIMPFQFYDLNDDIIPTVWNEPKIDLTKAVPDMTYGNLVDITKKWLNYNFFVKDNFVYMNKVTDGIDIPNAISLQDYEIPEPSRRPQKGYSFLHKFSDIDSTKFIYKPIFINASGFVDTGYQTNDKTTTIEIPALPLPQYERNNIETAYAFIDDSSKMFVVKYEGLFNGQNLSISNDDILIPAIFPEYWQKWDEFRIFAIPFKWQFKAHFLDIKGISIDNNIYAYNRYHVVKTINRTEIKPDIFEIDLDTVAF
jgi:hypothetical protein